jgi:hypothetical protein
MKNFIIAVLAIIILIMGIDHINSDTSQFFSGNSSSCDDPEIKGNQTTYNGELIYHVPGGRYYDVTDAEELFCTEEEAEEAGYRASEY